MAGIKYNHANADENYKKYLESIKQNAASQGRSTATLESGNNSYNGYNYTGLSEQIEQGNTNAMAHAIALAKSAGTVSKKSYVLPSAPNGSSISIDRSSADKNINALTKSLFSERQVKGMGLSNDITLRNNLGLGMDASDSSINEFRRKALTKSAKQENRKLAHSIVDNISDDVKAKIDEAVKMNGGRTTSRTLSDIAYQSGDNTGATETTNVVENVLKKNGYSDEEARYVGENWDKLKGILSTENYEKKRSKALSAQSDEAYELAKKYIEANSKPNIVSDIDYQIGGIEERNKQDETRDILTKLMAETGLSLNDTYKYIQYVGEKEDEYATLAMQEHIKNDIDNHPILNSIKWTAADIATSPVSGLMAASEALHRPADSEAPINTNSAGYMAQNMGTFTEEAVSDKINNPVGRFLYGTGVSIGKSALSMATGAGMAKALGLAGDAATLASEAVTLPSFGGSAFASTLKEGQDKGLSDEQSVKYAIASGLAEMIFEKVSMDKVVDTYLKASAGKTGLKATLKNLGMTAAVEGSEEVFTDIANAISDDAINSAFSEAQSNIRNFVKQGMTEEEAKDKAKGIFMTQLAESFAGGAIAGAAHGGGAHLAGTIKYKSMANAIDSDSKLAGVKKSVIETAKKAPLGSTARNIVDSKDTSEINAADLKNILESEAGLAGNEKTVEEFVAEKVKAAGYTGAEAKEITDTLVESAYTASENVTEESENRLNETLAKSEELTDIYADTLKGEYQANSKTLSEAGEAVEQVKAINKAAANISKEDKKLVDDYKKGAKNGVVPVKSAGKDAYLLSISSSGKFKVYDSETGSRTVSAGEVEFETPDTRVVWQVMSQTTKIENNKDATRIARLFEETNTPATVYIDAAIKAYDGALSGIKLSDIENSSVLISQVPESTIREIYFLGENERNAIRTPVNTNASARKEDATTKYTKTAVGAVPKGEEALAKVMSKITGMDVVYTGQNKYGSNAYIDFNRRVIVVALDHVAGDYLEETDTLRALGHETIGEYIEHMNPEGKELVNEAVKDILVKAYGADTITKAVKVRQQEYRKLVESGKTMEEAMEEIINDMVSDIMFTEEGMDLLVSYANENMNASERKTFFETLLDLIQKAIDTIKGYLASKGTRDIVAKSNLKDLENARAIIMRELDKAVKNDMAGRNAGQSTDNVAHSAGNNKGYYLDEEGFPIISEQVFSNSKIKNDFKTVSRAVKNTLHSMVGERITIASDNSIVEIGSDMPEEYVSSRATQSMRREDKRAKMNMIPAIRETIRTAFNGRWEENKEAKHNKNAARGWRTYNVRFGSDSSEGITYFAGKLKVRMDENGTDYVYDIVDIKKKGLRIRIAPVKDSTFGNRESSLKDTISPSDENASEIYKKALKEAGKENKSFSVGSPIEQTAKLLAVHNLTAEQLMDTFKLGGFPSPSIAIIRNGMGHEKYGPISVVFDKDTIDPANKDNHVYGADAYTPTIENVDYEVKTDELDEFRKELNTAYDSLDKYFNHSEVFRLISELNGVSSHLSADELFEKYKNQTALKAAFAELNGKHVVPVKTEVEKDYKEDRVDSYNKVLAHYGEDAVQAYYWTRGKSDEQTAWYEEHGAGLLDEIVKGEADFKEGKPAFYLRMKRGNLLLETYHYMKEKDSAPKYTVDTEETDKAVNEALKGMEDKYETWLKERINSFIGEKGIWNNKSYITDSGNRRTWKQLYNKYTAENIVKAMYDGQSARGQNAYALSAEGLQSAAAKEYKNIENMRADSKRLTHVEEEEYKQIMSEATDKILSLADEIKSQVKDKWLYNNPVGDALIEAAKGKRTLNTVKRAFKVEGLTLNNEMAGRVLDLYEEIAKLPSMYFEAKPHRVVGTNEISYVILPEDSSEELFAMLKDNGIEYRTYISDDEADRLDKLNEISDSVAFSVGTELSLPENDSKRAELLRHMTITPAQFDENEYKKYANVEKLENSFKSEAENIVKPIYKALGNTKVYKNYDIDLEFLYTTKGFLESLYNQQLREKEVGEKDFSSFAKLHTCLDEVIQKAKCIYESDEDRYAGTYRENPFFKKVYSLIGLFEDKESLYPVRFIVKEMRGGNRLYIAVALNCIKKTDVMALLPSNEDYRELGLFSNVNVARLIQFVNSKDGEFFKYVPDELLNEEQKESKAKALAREQEKLETLRKTTEKSTSIDSKGNTLTDSQVNYFKESKVRDEDGNLLLVYHGTPSGGFEEFHSPAGMYYFTSNRKYANRYKDPSASSRVYEVNQSNPMVYEGYINIKKPFDLADAECKRIYVEEYIKGGYAQGINPYISDSEIEKQIAGGIDWTEAENLKEFFEDYEYDYDGIIIDEGGDITDKGVYDRGNSYVIFDSSQFKSRDNKNPSKVKNINHSAGDWDDILGLAEADVSGVLIDDDSPVGVANKNAVSIISEGMESLKKIGVEVDSKLVHNVARSILNEYGSKYDADKLEKNLTNLFAYMSDHDTASYNDMMRVADELAKPILSEAVVKDEAAREDRERIVKYLKSHKISLDEEQKREVAYVYGSYNVFRMQNGLMSTWSNEGTPLDRIWDELCDESNGYLNRGVSSSDEPITILETLDALAAKEHKVYEGKTLDDAAHDLAIDIFKRYFEGMAGESQKMNKTLRASLTKTTVELLTAKKELDKAYAKRQREEAPAAKAEADAVAKRQYDTLMSIVANLDTDIQQMRREGSTDVVYMLLEQKQRYEERIKKLEKDNKNFKQVSARQRNSKIKHIEEMQGRELKKRIGKNMDKLNAMLRDETEKKHVPVDMVKDVIEVCKLVTPKQTNSKLLKQKLAKLSQLYNSYQSDGTFMQANVGFNAENTSYVDYDRNLADKIKRLSDVLEGRDYRGLSNNDLQEVYEITKAVLTQVRNANKLIANAKLQNAYEGSRKAMEEIRESGGNKNEFEKALDTFGNKHLNAYRFFRKISGYKDDGAIMSLYNELDEGQRRMLQVQKEIDDIFDTVLEGKENQKNVKRLTSYDKKDMVDIGLKDDKGNPVLVTRAMRLSLIMHTYNESNMAHVLGDGITIPDMKLAKEGRYAEAYGERNAKTYRLVDYGQYISALESKDMDAIKKMQESAAAKIKELEKDLDDYEREFLKAAKKMFWEYTGKEINKVSVKLNGYAKAKVEHYYPIKVDPNFTARDYSGLIMDGTIEGMGMLKSRVMSKKAILLEDIVQVIMRQTKNVSLYSGMAIPMRDMNMIMNLTTKEHGTPHNLGEVIGRVWGVDNTTYLQNLMKDIQGGRDNGRSLFDNLRSKFAGATLNLNLVVAMKQAASYPTAAAVVGYGPLVKAIKDMGKGFALEKGIEELESRNSLLWYRNKGNSTQELGDIRQQKGFDAELSKFKFLNWIQWMDSGTVRTLEYASKYYVDEQIKKQSKGYEKMSEGSYEYWKAVDEVFSKVVEQTQPNYTTLQQADITRNPNRLIKQLFMFKTQPLQNFGIIYDAVGELRAKTKAHLKNKSEVSQAELRSAKEKFAKAISSQIVAALVYSAMDIFAKALILNRWWKYKDDEDKVQWEEMLKKVVFEGIPNTLLGGVIAGSEIYSLVNSWITGSTYYGVEVSAVETINDLTSNLTGIITSSDKYREAVTEEDRDKYLGKIKDYAKSLGTSTATFFGVPLTNISNMFESITRYANDISEGQPLGATAPDDETIEKQMDRIADAYISGDRNRYKELRDEEISEKLNSLKEDNPDTEADETDAKEAVDSSILNKLKSRYLNGQMPESKLISYLTETYGYTEAKAEEMIADWDFSDEVKSLTGAFESEVKKKHELVDNVVIQKEFEALADMGYEEDKLNNKLKTSLKDAYKSGRVSYEDAYEYLQTIGDDPESNDGVDEAFFTLERWDYLDEGSYDKYSNLNEALENDDMAAFNEAKNTLLSHGIEEDIILSKVKTAVERLYSSGAITLDRAYSIMNSAGVDADGITSKMKTMIKDAYTNESLGYNEALSALQKYGLEDSGDAYYDLEEAKAKKNGAESYSKYDALVSAIDAGNGKNIVAEVNDLINHGVEAKTVQSRITANYKAKFLELKEKGRAADLQNSLISAYMACGKSKSEAMKMIGKWK